MLTVIHLSVNNIVIYKLGLMDEYMGNIETVCHGTNKKTYDNEIKPNGNVLQSKFISTDRMPNDLGDGIYFFGSNELFKGNVCAEKYASKYRNKDGNHITLLFYKLDMDEKHTLDLDEEVHKTNFIKKRQQMENHLKSMIEKFNSNVSRKQLDGILINIITKKLGDAVKIVKKQTYTAFDDIYQTSNFPNSLEICVKDNSLLIFNNHVHKKIKGD